MNNRFTSIISGVIFASISLNVSQVFAQSDNFSAKQLTQVQEIKQQALNSDLAWDLVESLTTEVGPRMPGTLGDEAAVAWAIAKFKTLGFDKVWTEPATFPKWIRYSESAEIVSPAPQKLHITALGNSISTPKNGIEAQVIEFKDLAELESAPENAAKGKIVFINYRMNRDRDGNGYGPAVQARSRGAIVAAQKGAVGYVMRSVSTAYHRFAHTGGSHYKEGVTKIVASAISNADADQLHRLLALEKPVSININVQAKSMGEGTSYNVIAEFTGDKFPEQHVLIGGHLDSWDLGTGALDDGAGVAITMAAAKLAVSNGKPKRSIRVVLFAAEEFGLWGAKAYVKANEKSISNIVAAAESDFGADKVWAFDSNVHTSALPLISEIAAMMQSLDVKFLAKNTAGGGPDLIPFRKYKIPAFGLSQDGTDYFDYHHTADDTLDKIDPAKLRQNVATYAVFAYMTANAKTRITGK
ncbi:M20/M25/M40 family metallo-hydrolase [Colwellia psychrerythraea]|uniref:Carboxypeptidase Q n=1 Tax=Colwellia psychrerythraea TaxID=28229 RepID=A0A099KV74_COLPS|nr:M20/M25/M40 family metallo-hydrolase [Colwellia psychrerythraea]KGJ93762.1 peptidase M28 [Colwellia psychrerythraea]